jgi:serine/threonine protein kinase
MGCASSSNANDCKRRDKNICKREDDSSLICNAAIREGDLIINVCNSYDRKRIEDSFEADWKSDEKYPSGGSAVIMPYKHKKSGCVFAFKKLKPKSKITNIISEFKILRSLDHPNIIRPLGNYGSDNLLLEYCHGGDLFNRLKSQHFLSEASARSYVYTLCYVLKYLHSNKILHGDLKLENIMMEDSLLTSDIKLIGISQQIVLFLHWCD